MSVSERRLKVLQILFIRRHDTYQNLADEFDVTRETIRKDVTELMRYYPIETRRGRHGGGVWMAEWYYRSHGSSANNELNPEQTAVLRKMMNCADDRDREVIAGILIQFAPRPTVP